MAKFPVAWAVCVVVSGALGLKVFADAGQGIVFPMLLDFQPVIVALDPTANIQNQLLQFCIAHLLDLGRCHVLQDAVADVVRREKGCRRLACRPTDKPLAPSFALVKNLLVGIDSSEQQPSFQWLEDSPLNIATDICSFLARSQKAIDVSPASCAQPLATAITQSFRWLNAIPVCDSDADRVQPSMHVQLAGRGQSAYRIRDEKTTIEATKMAGGDPQITITPMEFVHSSDAGTMKQSERQDDGDDGRPHNRPIRIAPVVDSISVIGVPTPLEGTRDDTTVEADNFMADAMVVVALLAVVMLAQWLRILLIAQHKSIEIESVSPRSGKAVVAPLEVDSGDTSATSDPSPSPPHERNLDQSLVILHRINTRSLTRLALLRWRVATRSREALTVETHVRLHMVHDRHGANEPSAADDSLPSPLGTPASSSTHRRVPSYSLVAMSLLMPPCSPMASSSPGGTRAEPDTPLARVTRLLEAESATTLLLDQFDADRLAAEHRCEAARRIQRVWRSWRSSATLGNGRNDAKKQIRAQGLPHRASQLLRQVQRLQSRFSTPREGPVGQSASSA